MWEVIEKATGRRVYYNSDKVRCVMFMHWTPEDSDEPSQPERYELRET